MVKLSKANKMPCRSWSLQALETCPSARDDNGDIVPACKGCYALAGNYHFKNVKASRAYNKKDWQRDDWVNDMVAELDNDRYFRWFDSGDMYHIKLAEKIYEVCKRTPWIKHWIPTRMYKEKFKKFHAILEKFNELNNVIVRYSSDSINGEIVQGAKYSSTIITEEQIKDSKNVCYAFKNNGKCGTCRVCWDKSISVVSYVGHGQTMKKQQRDLIKTLAI